MDDRFTPDILLTKFVSRKVFLTRQIDVGGAARGWVDARLRPPGGRWEEAGGPRPSAHGPRGARRTGSPPSAPVPARTDPACPPRPKRWRASASRASALRRGWDRVVRWTRRDSSCDR